MRMFASSEYSFSFDIMKKELFSQISFQKFCNSCDLKISLSLYLNVRDDSIWKFPQCINFGSETDFSPIYKIFESTLFVLVFARTNFLALHHRENLKFSGGSIFAHLLSWKFSFGLIFAHLEYNYIKKHENCMGNELRTQNRWFKILATYSSFTEIPGVFFIGSHH